MELKWSTGTGVLTRELRVRVIDISGSGCLIACRRRMEVGAVGRMRLRLGIEEYSDDIQVVRCEAIEGAARVYHVGVRFLWTTSRHPGSIRHAVARHAAALKTSSFTLRLM